MPIVFVHGVAVRGGESWPAIETYLRRYVAPAIASDASRVDIRRAYWGDIGVRFAWNGASRPRTPLLGQGAEGDPSPLDGASALLTMRDLGALDDFDAGAPAGSALAPMGPARTASSASTPLDLRNLSPDELSDLLSQIFIEDPTASDEEHAARIIAADEVAHDSATASKLGATSPDDQVECLLELVRARLAAAQRLAGMGAPLWLQKAFDRLREATARAEGLPGFVAARAAAEFRRPLNDGATTFLGDVFVYLKTRLDENRQRGAIPKLVLDTLRQAAAYPVPSTEPLVVLSHSMGGQIVYDLVTTFIPEARAAGEAVPRIDFWCATASQVGLFEEAKLFIASKDAIKAGATPSLVPFPDRNVLGGWWNVWDHTDFVSYTVRDIIDGVDDESFSAGMFQAHSGYLARPRFYRRFASKLAQAKQQNWWRP